MADLDECTCCGAPMEAGTTRYITNTCSKECARTTRLGDIIKVLQRTNRWLETLAHWLEEINNTKDSEEQTNG